MESDRGHRQAERVLRLAGAPGYLSRESWSRWTDSDVVTIRRSDRRAVDSPVARNEANLAWKALDALGRNRRTAAAPRGDREADPREAGLGGGSSNAAALRRQPTARTGPRRPDSRPPRRGSVPFLIAANAVGRGRGPPGAHDYVEGSGRCRHPVRGLSTPAVYRGSTSGARTPSRHRTDRGAMVPVRNDGRRTRPAFGACAALGRTRPVRVLLCGCAGPWPRSSDDPDRCRAAASDWAAGADPVRKSHLRISRLAADGVLGSGFRTRGAPRTDARFDRWTRSSATGHRSTSNTRSHGHRNVLASP